MIAPASNSKKLLFIRPHCNNFYSISSRKNNNNTTKHNNYFAFCQRKNERLSQTWRILAQTLKGPGLQITRNRTSRLLKQQWSIKNIWVHPSHNLQRWPWSQVKRKRKMFFRWVLSPGQPPKCLKVTRPSFFFFWGGGGTILLWSSLVTEIFPSRVGLIIGLH